MVGNYFVLTNYFIELFFLQVKKENVPARKDSKGMAPSYPNLRVFWFSDQKYKLAEAKKDLLMSCPDFSSVVFLSSSANQFGLNGWINFDSERKCENFVRSVKQEPPKNVLRLLKTGNQKGTQCFPKTVKQASSSADGLRRLRWKKRETRIQKTWIFVFCLVEFILVRTIFNSRLCFDKQYSMQY